MATCPGCGLETPGGEATCQTLFHELTARDAGDYRYARFHRIAVDAYSLQHPEQYCISAKSLMAHLGGLCCAFEFDGESEVYHALLRSLNGAPALEKPALPAFRGHVTIADVLRAAEPESHGHEVRRWARSVWEAHSSLHPFARGWLAKALADRQGPVRPRHGGRKEAIK
ncbi:MAG: hypothetical protein DMG59_20965 [Acidobacteria bacterium]|nr:MAG: hypothetical protein DMG59_20965 [Acidobacteriota bacterium]